MKKQQPNLFSFFKKAPSSNPSSIISNVSETVICNSPQIVIDKISKDVVKPHVVVNNEKNEDDDDIVVKKKPTLAKKGNVVLSDEEEWNSTEESSNASEASNSDFSESCDESPSKKRRLDKRIAAETSSKPPISKKSSSTPQKINPPASSPSISSTKSATPVNQKLMLSQSPSTTPASMTVTPVQKSKPTSSTPTSHQKGAETEYPNDADDNFGDVNATGVFNAGSHEHDTWPFLQLANRKDINKRVVTDVNYNPRTLYVPTSFLNEQTPAMKQWFDFKCKNMDTVLFFKVGKFYELFHMDADVGVKELDLIYMKGVKAHSGFPEVAYGKYSSILVSKGFRVARVEQTETPEMMKERNKAKKGTKEVTSKVVARELCSVMSKGTRTFCHMDDMTLLDDAKEVSDGGITNTSKSLLMCIKENIIMTKIPNTNMSLDNEQCDDDDEEEELLAVVSYGVCFCDTVLSTLTFGQFDDNALRNRLKTLLIQYTPTEIMLEHEKYSSELFNIIKFFCPHAVIDILKGSDEVYTENEVCQLLHRNKYFRTESGKNSQECIPVILNHVLDGLETNSSNLVVSAFGGVLYQLQRSLIDFEILSLGRCYAYIPLEETEYKGHVSSSFLEQINHNSDMDVVKSDGTSSNLDLKKVWNEVSDSELLASNTLSSSIGTPTTMTTMTTMTTLNVTDMASMTNQSRHMILDAVTINNLEIFVNSYDRTEKGSLWSFVNRTKTIFGRRVLREWVNKPLYQIQDISLRRDAIEELLTNSQVETWEKVKQKMKGLPDLERLLGRVHSNGISRKNINHPESRAVMYENHIYNGKKIKDFSDIIQGFQSFVSIFDELIKSGILLHSSLLTTLLGTVNQHNVDKTNLNTGKFPYYEVKKLLRYFNEIFDEKQAKRDGFIQPKAGVDTNYDDAKNDIIKIEKLFENYLIEQKKLYGISDMCYFGSNKDRYQLEVPMSAVNKIPKHWATKSQKKTHRRFHTEWIEETFQRLVECEDRLAFAQKDTMRKIFEKFDENRHTWSISVSCFGVLDALLSLATVSFSPNYCWPTLLQRDQNKHLHGGRGDCSLESSVAILQIKEGRHPMLEHVLAERGDKFYIPNTLDLGGAQTDLYQNNSLEYNPKLLLLSGPNMGGKSTLLRQTCLIAILAQLGCKVPAESCTMTPIDRIFTRIGASDKILAGQSTFFVELSETATILKYATTNSLCILDELGRGTSTFDGTAIAHAVINYFVNKIKCLVLFATHYHSLINDWSFDPRIKLGHMECIVEHTNSNSENTPSALDQDVTFLYKLCNGSSPRSYGINVAKLARLPLEVLRVAEQRSNFFETAMYASHQKETSSSSDQMQDMTSDAFNNKRILMVQFYDHIIPILQNYDSPSDTSVDKLHNDAEFVWIMSELWRRFVHLSK